MTTEHHHDDLGPSDSIRVICPECLREIGADGVNAATDVAHCGACNRVFALSELVQRAAEERAEAAKGSSRIRGRGRRGLDDPPPGVWVKDLMDGRALVVSLRSVAGGVIATAVMLFWNSIAGAFGLIAVTRLLGLPPGIEMTQEGNPERVMSAGMAWLILAILVPFVVAGAGFVWLAMAAWFGRTEVRLTSEGGAVVTKVGPFGLPRRFDPGLVERVKLVGGGESDEREAVVIEAGPRRIKLGGMMTEERRRWALRWLRRELIGRKG